MVRIWGDFEGFFIGKFNGHKGSKALRCDKNRKDVLCVDVSYLKARGLGFDIVFSTDILSLVGQGFGFILLK